MPVESVHLVFPLPPALNPLAHGTPRLISRLLFHATADTLAAFAHDPQHLGGELGVTAILHTWGQHLSQPLHLHCVVTGGALGRDGSRWSPAPPGCLFPVQALAEVFRGTYLDALQPAFEAGPLIFAGSIHALAGPGAFAAWLAQLRQHDWVGYATRPFAGPAHLLESLGRYPHRVALSTERIVSLDDGIVRFRWKDYADGNRVKVMELAAAECIRRFLLHVVPTGFVRIRPFGLLANRTRKTKLARCRQLLHQSPAPARAEPETVRALMLRVTGVDLERCPVCQQGRRRRTDILPAAARLLSPHVQAWDTC